MSDLLEPVFMVVIEVMVAFVCWPDLEVKVSVIK